MKMTDSLSDSQKEFLIKNSSIAEKYIQTMRKTIPTQTLTDAFSQVFNHSWHIAGQLKLE